jgi:hypothetical protein
VQLSVFRLDLPNQTSVQKKPRTLFRTRRYFIGTGHVALLKHDGALRIHAHHAAQHAGGHLGMIKLDLSAFALATQPSRYTFIGSTDGELIKGRRNLGKLAAAAEFEMKGYAATCMADVAQRVGVSTKTVYRLIPTRRIADARRVRPHRKVLA